MPDVVHLVVQKEEFGDVLLDKAEVLVPAQMRDIVHRAGDEVVDPDDAMSFFQEIISEVGAEETGRTGHNGYRSRGFGAFTLRSSGHRSLGAFHTGGRVIA